MSRSGTTAFRYWLWYVRDDGVIGANIPDDDSCLHSPLTLTGRKQALARAQRIATEKGCGVAVTRWRPGMPGMEQVGSVSA